MINKEDFREFLVDIAEFAAFFFWLGTVVLTVIVAYWWLTSEIRQNVFSPEPAIEILGFFGLIAFEIWQAIKAWKDSQERMKDKTEILSGQQQIKDDINKQMAVGNEKNQQTTIETGEQTQQRVEEESNRVIESQHHVAENIKEHTSVGVEQVQQVTVEQADRVISDVAEKVSMLKNIIESGLDENQEKVGQLTELWLLNQHQLLESIIKTTIEAEFQKRKEIVELVKKDSESEQLRHDLILTFVRFRDQFARTKQKQHVDSLNDLRLEILDLSQKSEVYFQDDLKDIYHIILSTYLELIVAIDRHERNVRAPEETKEQWRKRIHGKRNEELYSQVNSATEEVKRRLYNKTRQVLSSDTPESLTSATKTVTNAYLALFNEEATKRFSAIETLYQSEDSYSIIALELAQTNSIPQVRIHSAIALAEKTDGKNAQSIMGLLEALKLEDSETKHRALQSINNVFNENPETITYNAVNTLIESLRLPDAKNQWTAVHILIANCEKTISQLVEAIKHDSRQVRIAVMEGIWIMSYSPNSCQKLLGEYVENLVEALQIYDGGRTPADNKETSINKLAEEALINLSPIEQLQTYLNNNRTWLHKDVKQVLQKIEAKKQDESH